MVLIDMVDNGGDMVYNGHGMVDTGCDMCAMVLVGLTVVWGWSKMAVIYSTMALT